MKFYINQFSGLIVIVFWMTACAGNQDQGIQEDLPHMKAGGTGEEAGKKVPLTTSQCEALKMKVDTMPIKNISSVVQANGELEVPPQNEATVTAILGANVSSIQVLEGEDVHRGQVLVYLSHPDLTRLQSDYLEAVNQFQFLEQEYQRQKRLYEEEVGSGKVFQQTRSEYLSAQTAVKSMGSQLRQLGINEKRIQEGDFYDRIPVVSPIEGSVSRVNIKTGQYVPPEKELFEIVNTHHIHADLMVFEKDVFKVKVGQRIRFSVETLPEDELFARIYSVGKKFEKDPKAVHIHAEIENKRGRLIPGMYIKGQILTDSVGSRSLPEEAITRDGDRYFTFTAEKKKSGNDETWLFTPIEIRTGVSYDGWVAVTPLEEIPEGTLFAMNNAYYLLAEMKKEEAGHSH